MRKIMLAAALFSLTCAAGASDWTQWFGTNHDGSTDEKIASTWPASGPKVLWKSPVGEGLGTPAVVGGKVYIMAETQGATGAPA